MTFEKEKKMSSPQKILDILNSQNNQAKIAILQSLAQDDNYDLPNIVVKKIENMTQDSDVAICFWAKKIYSAIRNKGQQLEETLNLNDSLTLTELFKIVEEPSSTQHKTLKALERIFQKKEPNSYGQIVNFLRKCQNKVIISFLVKNLGIFYPSEKTLVIIFPYLKSDDERVIANAIEGIASIPTKKSVEVITQLLNHKNHRIKANATKALAKQNPETAKSAILDMLKAKEKPHYIIAACHAIDYINCEDFLPELIKLIPNTLVGEIALEATVTIGGEIAAGYLKELQNSCDLEMNKKINLAINKIERKTQLKEVEVVITGALDKSKEVVTKISNSIMGKLGELVQKEGYEELCKNEADLQPKGAVNKEAPHLENKVGNKDLSANNNNIKTSEKITKKTENNLGTNVSNKICDSCGKEITKKFSKRCDFCGKTIISKAPAKKREDEKTNIEHYPIVVKQPVKSLAKQQNKEDFPTMPDEEELFIEMALVLGFINMTDLTKALENQKVDFAIGIKKHIGSYFTKINKMTDLQFNQILNLQTKYEKKKDGEDVVLKADAPIAHPPKKSTKNSSFFILAIFVILFFILQGSSEKNKRRNIGKTQETEQGIDENGETRDKPYPMSNENIQTLEKEIARAFNKAVPTPAQSRDELILTVYKKTIEDRFGYNFDKTLRQAIAYALLHISGRGASVLGIPINIIEYDTEMALKKGFISKRTYEIFNLIKTAKSPLTDEEEQFLNFVAESQSRNGGVCNLKALLATLSYHKILLRKDYEAENQGLMELKIRHKMGEKFGGLSKYGINRWLTTPDGKEYNSNFINNGFFIVNKKQVGLSKKLTEILEEEKILLGQ